MNDEEKGEILDRDKRKFMQKTMGLSAAATLMGMVAPGVRNAAWAGGSDKPEKSTVNIGFIPLTDCASVVMASVKGFDRKYGVTITPSKQASWAAVRDKLVSGELDASHVLYGLVYGVQMGVGGPQKNMAVLMTLSNNGQGISLANHFKGKGVTDGHSLAKLISARAGSGLAPRGHPRHGGANPYTFAQTFPTGTHAMWLYYWLAAHGIDPLAQTRLITVPPPQMVANMCAGNMDGFCVGEPWNARAIQDGIGFTAATSQDIWADHPEKVLGTTREFVEHYPNTARAMIMALLEASRYVDTMSHRAEVAQVIAGKAYIDTEPGVIEDRMLGYYSDGLGRTWHDHHFMKFCDDGRVNFPYLSDGMWFLTQHRRWGLLKQDPDYRTVAAGVNQVTLYREAAAQVRVPLPEADMRSSKLIDGVVWDGSNPKAYAGGFAIRA